MSFDTIIVSPHADDAALSLGGGLVISRFGRTAVIVVFSQTNFRIGGIGRPAVVTATRRLEELNALSRWVSEIRFLGHKDNSLEKRTAKDVAAVTAHLRSVLDDMPATANSLLLFPMGIGNHPDHCMLSMVGTKFKWSGLKGYFEDQPYAALSAELRVPPHCGAHALERTTIESDFGPKARLLRFYRSQGLAFYLDALERHHASCGGEVIYCE